MYHGMSTAGGIVGIGMASEVRHTGYCQCAAHDGYTVSGYILYTALRVYPVVYMIPDTP